MIFMRKKISFLEPPLQNYNGCSKHKEFVSFENPYNATYQMNQNFIRIDIMQSKNSLNQPEELSMQKIAKNQEFYIYLKKRF